MDIRKDALERFLKPHLLTVRTDKWITCISKVLPSKRKKVSRIKRYFKGKEMSLLIIYVQGD